MSLHDDTPGGGEYFNLLDDLILREPFAHCRMTVDPRELLELRVEGSVWVRLSAVVAYRGNFAFVREGELEPGVDGLWHTEKDDYRAVLTRIRGQGELFLHPRGGVVSVLHMHEQAIVLTAREEQLFQHVLGQRREAQGAVLRLSDEPEHAQEDAPPARTSSVLSMRALQLPVRVPVSPSSPIYAESRWAASVEGALTPQIAPDLWIRSQRHGWRQWTPTRLGGRGCVILDSAAV